MIDVQYIKLHKDFMRTRFMNKVDFSEQGSFARLLTEYGVDNEFDLMEAMYNRFCEESPEQLTSELFYNRRLHCAMNPEYTKKCLASSAFADIREDILARL